MSLGPEDFADNPLLDMLADHPLLARTLGPRDGHGYYGRREVDGQVVAIVPLTFGRARIVVIDPVSDCPRDGW